MGIQFDLPVVGLVIGFPQEKDDVKKTLILRLNIKKSMVSDGLFVMQTPARHTIV